MRSGQWTAKRIRSSVAVGENEVKSELEEGDQFWFGLEGLMEEVALSLTRPEELKTVPRHLAHQAPVSLGIKTPNGSGIISDERSR